jgi:exonuclease SbcC
MRLHRLTLRAIGPYAGEHSIDFGELGASGVFLLDGPTGSGKSTIIDAIVYSLYGSLAGTQSSDDRLHSHHAAPSVEPFVQLVVETGSGIYRIRRTPPWERPKSRGSGRTRQNAKAVLERLTSPDAVAGEPVSSSTQEIGHEMPAILGLTREQFTQTVVLPQGEFAQFLAASGENRRQVLQSLFGTKIYDDTTAVLVDLRRAANSEVGAAQKAVDEALAGLRGAADDDELTRDAAPGVVAGFARAAAEAEGLRDDARAARDAAEARLVAEKGLADALARRAGLTRRRDALAAEEEAIGDARRRAAAAERAATVHPARTAHESAEHEVARAAAVVVEREDAAPALAALAADDLAARRDDLLRQIGTLSGVVELERGLSGRATALARGGDALVAASEKAAGDADALTRRSEEREELTARQATAQQAAAGAEAAERRVRELESLETEVRELAALDTALETANGRVVTIATRATAAVEAENALRLRRIRGMAGEIASTLVDGEPCVVCGSTSHPSPATLTADHPTDDDIDRAESDRRRAEILLQAARDDSTTLTTRREELAKRVGDATAETVAADLTTARAARTAAATAAAESAAASLSLARFDEATRELERETRSADVRNAAAAERLEGERRALDADRARVTEALAGRAETCAELVAALTDDERRASALIAARQAHERALGDESGRRSELAAALQGAGFDDVASLDRATLARDELSALRDRVAAHDRESDLVASQLAVGEIAVLTGDETADVEGAAAALEAARQLFEEMAGVASVAGDRAGRALRALRLLQAASSAAEAASSRARAVVRMADVASASGPENLRGVTLGTYVLLRRFDDVLSAANVRLAVMSSGRYRLESSDEREKGSGSRKTGLALAIRDNATDTTRDPKSFSGGETFYASLSLALGLADVVQSEAGGIDLGTLFVDEGFGSLDPETLDAVMSELGRLSAGGRSVGIVSHVDELKQRIADRIEVRRLPDGSSTLRSTVS